MKTVVKKRSVLELLTAHYFNVSTGVEEEERVYTHRGVIGMAWIKFV